MHFCLSTLIRVTLTTSERSGDCTVDLSLPRCTSSLFTFHNFSSARSESFVDGGGGAAAVLAHHGAIIVGVWRISPDLNGVKCPLIVTAHGGEGYASALLFLPHEVTI